MRQRRKFRNRALDFIDRQNAEFDAKRRELGVEDAVTEVPGVTTAMLVAFGENDIKTVEDVAGCVTDDLIGWYEHVDGERTRMEGIPGRI